MIQPCDRKCAFVYDPENCECAIEAEDPFQRERYEDCDCVDPCPACNTTAIGEE